MPYKDNGHIVEALILPSKPASLRRMAHFQPERTHEIGRGQDMVSICKSNSAALSLLRSFLRGVGMLKADADSVFYSGKHQEA